MDEKTLEEIKLQVYEQGYKDAQPEEEERILGIIITYAAVLRQHGDNSGADVILRLYEFIEKGLYKLTLNIKK